MDTKPPKDTSGTRPIPPISRKSMESGVVTPGAVSENRMPETAVLEAVNFDFDAIGSAKLRAGTTAIGSNLSSAILGMHYFVDTVNVAAPKTKLVVVAGANAYYLNGSAFSSIRGGLTATSKARFQTYLNFCFMVNGTEPTMVWNGDPATSFVSTGNAASAPTGTFIENYRSRMWISGNSTYPSRLYYSSIPSSVTTPVISWNTAVDTGQWIDISPSDGDFMTGIQRFRNVLLCFKTNRLYRVFDIGQVDPDPYYAVGTSSQESIIESKAGVFFHHSTGFYQYNIYGIVQEISRPIIDIIRAIPTSAYGSVTGWMDPLGDHICWSIGNVTVNGVAYANMVVRYSISTQVWTTRSYPTALVSSLRRQPLYNDGTTQFALIGDTAGNVLKADTGVTDNGTPLFYSITHRWDTLDGLLSTRKNIMTANFSHYGGSGSTVAYQTEDNDPSGLTDWTKKADKGVFSSKNTGFNSMGIKARKFRFRVFGTSTGQSFTYHGYEIIDATNEKIQFTT